MMSGLVSAQLQEKTARAQLRSSVPARVAGERLLSQLDL
jgi:hypothetical protein